MADAKKLGLEFKVFEVPSWASYQLEVAVKEDVEYNKRIGSDIIYKQGEDGFECVDCGSEILASNVAHAILDDPFSISGSGKCEYEMVSYCPKCEEKPDYHGSPITDKKPDFF
jgi:hypothetical protein